MSLTTLLVSCYGPRRQLGWTAQAEGGDLASEVGQCKQNVAEFARIPTAKRRVLNS